jgi:Uncharacterized protein involved in propionate catabolism
VLGPVVDPQTVHQAKFSMGTTLGLIAQHRRADMAAFANDYNAPSIAAFRERVDMVLDAEVDQAYPQRWIGKVNVETTQGKTFEARVDEPKGDPGNTLSPAELEEKFHRLVAFTQAATPSEAEAMIAWVGALPGVATVGSIDV